MDQAKVDNPGCAALYNLACVISRQFNLITFVGLSRVTCVTQLHCLSNCFLNSAVKKSDTNNFVTQNSQKIEVSTTDEAGRVHEVTVCANTSSGDL